MTTASTASFLPMILTEGLLADGEAAQLLSIHNSAAVAVAKATGVVASPSRNGKMKLALLLQWEAGGEGVGGTIAPDDVLTLIVRSPYADDAGGQQNRPVVKLTYADAGGAIIAKPIGGAPGNPPAPVAADFSPTFNSKAIPNWTVVLQATSPSDASAAVYLEIDFGYTASN